MDVSKLVVSLGVLILVAVGVVFYIQLDQPELGPSRSNPAIAAHVEAVHGPALRAMGVRSLGVDHRTDDVVVVFAGGGRLGRRVAGRLPGLAGADGCGEVDVGLSIGESITAWGGSRDPSVRSRLDCIIAEVLNQAAELREAD
ncbi:hypothetical protein [Zoogloea sp.]|uniref:hypothetical protein n=1 Tax=Zoogloea sp. TaxID=49181 RepID=UPI001416AF00|nr:MAG: hypothetical protein F9K15_08520 [Zoogloea sp.]